MKNPLRTKTAPQAITSLPPSPDDERHARMVKYVTAMSIRMVCFLLFFFVQGWWLLLVGVGAVVLPYVGVVLANSVIRTPANIVRPPGGVVSIRENT